jgi:hypothetical protein
LSPVQQGGKEFVAPDQKVGFQKILCAYEKLPGLLGVLSGFQELGGPLQEVAHKGKFVPDVVIWLMGVVGAGYTKFGICFSHGQGGFAEKQPVLGGAHGLPLREWVGGADEEFRVFPLDLFQALVVISFSETLHLLQSSPALFGADRQRPLFQQFFFMDGTKQGGIRFFLKNLGKEAASQ